MAQQVGYIELFQRNINFRRLYSARLVSLFGDWLNLLAILALLRQMGGYSASSFGLVLILKMLPGVVVAPLAGLAADRYSRRWIMILADLIRAIAVAAMLLMMWWPSLVVLYSLVALQAALSAFFEPARRAILPDIVKPEELTAANALGAATWSAMLTVGAAVGGVVTSFLGWQVALLIDIASYLLSIWFLLQLVEPPLKQAEGESSRFGLSAIVGGLSYVKVRPRVLTMMLVKFVWSLSGPFVLTLTLLGEHVYAIAGAPMLAVSILYIARGLGTGLGPFLARGLSKSQPAAMERMILIGFLSSGGFYTLLFFQPPLWLACLIVVTAHLGGATIWVFSTVRLQQMVPTYVRGRVFATELALFTLAIVWSTWLYGKVFDLKWLSAPALPLLLGCLSMLGFLWWLWRGTRYGWATELSSNLERKV